MSKKKSVLIFIFFFPLILFSQNNKNNNNIEILKSKFDAEKNDSVQAEISKKIVEAWEKINQDSALYYAELYYNFFAVRKIEIGIFYNLQIISTIYSQENMYELAESKTIEGLKIIKNRTYRIILLTNLGETNRVIENYTSSLTQLKNAINLSKKEKDKKLLARAYNRIAAVYYELIKSKEAFAFADSSLKIAYKIGDSTLIANNLEIKGAVTNFNLDFYAAISYFTKALEINTLLNDSSAIQNNYFNLGLAYLRLANYDESLKYLFKSELLCKKMNSKMNLVYTLQYISLIYKKTNNFKKAYFVMDTILQLRKDLFNLKRDKEIQKLNKEYEINEKDQIIKRNNQEIKTKNNLLFLYIFILVLIIIFLVNLIITNSKTRKQKQKLSDLNSELNKSNENINDQNEKLVLLNSKYQRLLKFREISAQMIVHDLKNPLYQIIQMTKNENDKTSQVAQSMLNLVENLLYFSKIENDKFFINFFEINLNNIIDKAYEDTEFLFKNKGIIFKNNLDQIIIIQGDSQILKRVFINLFTNSIKFTKSGGTISISAKIKENLIQIEFSDTGLGIRKEKLDKIFDLYEHDASSNTDKISSSGIGLFFVKRALEEHKGSIFVESTENVGTKFILNFRLINSLVTTQKIIFIEDEPINFTNSDKLKLKDIIQELEKTEIFEISKIKNILNKIEENSANINIWKQKILESVENFNTNTFNKLLKMVKN